MITSCAACPPPPADAVPGLHGLLSAGSYLSLDTDGRVIRVDSFAKFLMPGGLWLWWCVVWCGVVWLVVVWLVVVRRGGSAQPSLAFAKFLMPGVLIVVWCGVAWQVSTG